MQVAATVDLTRLAEYSAARRAFAGLEGPGLDAFLSIGRSASIAPGTIICAPGQPLEGLVVVVEGRFALAKDDQPIRDFQPGDYFGEGALVREMSPGVTIKASEPSRLITFPRADCWDFFRKHPDFASVLLRQLMGELMSRLEATNVLFAENKQLAHKLERTVSALSTEMDERRRSEDRARHLATHDPLTGLGNRALFQDRLDIVLQRASRFGSRFAVLLVDLDEFKEINDIHGHPAGDEVLRMVAVRLRTCVRAVDTVARLGGDEFAIIQDLTEDDNVTEQLGVGVLCERIQQSLTEPIHVDELKFEIGCSIGVAIYPDDGSEADDLVRNADLALYRAKNEGRGRWCAFTADLGERVVQANLLKTELRDALSSDQLCVYYQPKVDLANGEIIGLEALVRWRHPVRGMMGPDYFVGVAERSGLVTALGTYVLRSACRQAAAWHADGLGMLTMSLNLSPVQFRHQDVASTVSAALEETGLDPGALELEVTETALFHDQDAVLAQLAAVKQLGVGVAVDDFGTGFASLSRLKRIAPRTVKIDASFVRNCVDDVDDRSIIRAIVSLAHSLDMIAVAEGVETVEQLSFLRKVRCDAVQGYLIAPPMPPEQARAWLERCLVHEIRAVARHVL